MSPTACLAAAPALTHNTLVVAAGVAAVGCAAGVVGSLSLLRKRPLIGDAAAHTTLVGVAAAFLLTGRRDLPTLLTGALVAAVAGLAFGYLFLRYGLPSAILLHFVNDYLTMPTDLFSSPTGALGIVTVMLVLFWALIGSVFFAFFHTEFYLDYG